MAIKPYFKSELTSNAATISNLFCTGVGGTKGIADPYISGYSFIKFYGVANLLSQIEYLYGQAYKDEYEKFFTLMERTVKEVQGLNDLDLGTAGIQGGFTANEHHYPTEISKNVNDITLKFQELSGGIYNTKFESWVTGIRDPETGLYMFKDYGLKHYSVEMLYVNTSPAVGTADDKARANSLENAFYFTCMFPTRVFYGHHNYSSGSHDANTEIDQPFKCNIHYGKGVKEFAKKYLATPEFYDNLISSTKFVYDGSSTGFGTNTKANFNDSSKPFAGGQPLT